MSITVEQVDYDGQISVPYNPHPIAVPYTDDIVLVVETDGGNWIKGRTYNIVYTTLSIQNREQYYNNQYNHWYDLILEYYYTIYPHNYLNESTYSGFFDTRSNAIANDYIGTGMVYIPNILYQSETIYSETIYSSYYSKYQYDTVRMRSIGLVRQITNRYTIPEDFTSGQYWFRAVEHGFYRDYDLDISQYVGFNNLVSVFTFPINITTAYEIPPPIIDPKPDHQDDVWDKDNQEWTDKTTSPEIYVAGGGRYQNRLVVLGHNKVYVEGL